jgi:hypothetical protein
MKQRNTDSVSLTRLTELLDAYGSEPSRWPEHERGSAVSLIASDASAAELHEAARLLDGQLDQLEVPDTAMALHARVLEIPIRHPRTQRRWLGLPNWAIAGLAMLACGLGFVSGVTTSSEPDDGWSEVAAVTLLSDSNEEDWP